MTIPHFQNKSDLSLYHRRRAFCLELNRVVSASDIWKLVFEPSFGQTRYYLSELTFKCAHPMCLSEVVPHACVLSSLPTEVTFRRVLKSAKHSLDCPLFVPLETAPTVPPVLEVPIPKRSQHVPYIPPHLRARRMYRDMKAGAFNSKASY